MNWNVTICAIIDCVQLNNQIFHMRLFVMLVRSNLDWNYFYFFLLRILAFGLLKSFTLKGVRGLAFLIFWFMTVLILTSVFPIARKLTLTVIVDLSHTAFLIVHRYFWISCYYIILQQLSNYHSDVDSQRFIEISKKINRFLLKIV